ncbi:hypothetical protein Tco_0327176 [Tanacetum coccineum]
MLISYVAPCVSALAGCDIKDFLKLVDSLNLDVANRERTRSISTWEDLTTRFLAKFFPPRRTAILRQIFYDHVNPATRRTIDQSTRGKLRDKNDKESWALLEDLALYDNESCNDPRDFARPVNAISLPQDVPSTFDHRLIELENQVQRLMEAHLAPKQPVQVNKISSLCEICSGPHDTQYCMENPEQAFVEYASPCTDESRDPQCSTRTHSSINTITICSKQPNKSCDDKSEEGRKEEGNPENTNTTPSSPPDPSISFITKKVRKLNSFLESSDLVPRSSDTEFVFTKDDGDVMFIEIIRKYDDSLKEGPEDEENTKIERKLDPRDNPNRGVSNFTRRIKGMHVFVENFTYVIDFMIVEDISSIVDPRLSQVVLGKPFVEISNITHDPSLGVVKFTDRINEIAYKMPHKIEQYDSLSDLEKEHMKSVNLRNEEDKRRGVEYVMSKILGFYKECLELGPEYLTGIANEGEVT